MTKTLSQFISFHWPIILILLLIAPTLFPLFHPGFFVMHDDQQVVRLFALDTALSGGQFPVRWVSHLGFGYGYPLFIFYPPLVYYLGEIYHLLLQASFIVSIKLVFATALIASALAMYFWAKHQFGRASGVTAALFYTYVPYKAVDAYVRGALAELFSFVWLPLILLGIDRLFSPKSTHPLRWCLLVSLSSAALVLTHPLIALPFALLLLLYLLFKLLFTLSKGVRPLRRPLLLVIGSLALATLLSASFWLPSLAEKRFTLVDQILLTEKYTYSQHFVYLGQLWNSIWGYGGSTAGTLDGISFKIGKLHLVLALFSLVLSLVHLYRRRLYSAAAAALTASILLSVAALLTTNYTAFVWDRFQPLQYLQFPWRFLTFTALFASFLAGSFIYFVRKLAGPVPAFGISLIAITLLFPPNLKLFRPQQYLDVTTPHYTSDEFAKWTISKTSFEFVPQGVATRAGENGVTQLALDRDQIATSAIKPSATATAKILTDYPHLKTVAVSAIQNTNFTFNTFNFPGWQARVDGTRVNINDNNPLKLVTVPVPSGDHTVTLEFTNTRVRSVANLLSLLGLFMIILLLLYPKLHHLTASRYVRRLTGR